VLTWRKSRGQRLPFARIKGVALHLPAHKLTNEAISAEFPEWDVAKISDKTGIQSRRIAGPNEFSSHLGICATQALIEKYSLDIASFDYLISVTQTPDFMLPGIASLIHEAVGMRPGSGALDVNLGCSGYVYGLGLAKGLIESGQASNVLLVTSDTYSKLLNPKDKSVRTIFGDGATATWVSSDGEAGSISGFSYGTDGSGGKHLMVPNGGLRSGGDVSPKSSNEIRGLQAGQFDLFMDGPEIFNFTLRVVGSTMEDVLGKSNLEEADVDYFVFHQANSFMLEHLVSKLCIPVEKAPILMREWGNTVSGTIPMALCELEKSGLTNVGSRLVLLGFGVGLSWAGVAVRL